MSFWGPFQWLEIENFFGVRLIQRLGRVFQVFLFANTNGKKVLGELSDLRDCVVLDLPIYQTSTHSIKKLTKPLLVARF